MRVVVFREQKVILSSCFFIHEKSRIQWVLVVNSTIYVIFRANEQNKFRNWTRKSLKNYFVNNRNCTRKNPSHRFFFVNYFLTLCTNFFTVSIVLEINEISLCSFNSKVSCRNYFSVSYNSRKLISRTTNEQIIAKVCDFRRMCSSERKKLENRHKLGLSLFLWSQYGF